MVGRKSYSEHFRQVEVSQIVKPGRKANWTI